MHGPQKGVAANPPLLLSCVLLDFQDIRHQYHNLQFEAAYPFGSSWRRTWCWLVLDAHAAGSPAPCKVQTS